MIELVVSALAQIEDGIDELLDQSPYGKEPERRHADLLLLFKRELQYACQQNAKFRNYVEHWPINLQDADEIADLPYLPVRIFKTDPPLALVGSDEVKRTLTSSATTGQTPSRIVLDAPTSRRMTKGVTSIIRDFIGGSRRPYLVIDTAENFHGGASLGARGAAIQGLASFATEIVCCLRAAADGTPVLDHEKILDCVERWREVEVLIYGFTHVLWTELVQPLTKVGISLNLPKAHVLHSGGWKRLQEQAVSKDAFNQGVADVIGCAADRVIDYYGMVENVGVVYPDCAYGNKHVPSFAQVIVRDPLTLRPVRSGERGLIQVCSVLPTSFPGFLLLTEDMAEIISYDGCACGRRGTAFRFAGRAPKAEIRGCGNLERTRQQHLQKAGLV